MTHKFLCSCKRTNRMINDMQMKDIFLRTIFFFAFISIYYSKKMGSPSSKIEFYGNVYDCSECNRFVPFKEIECLQCNTFDQNRIHQCDILSSGKYGYVIFKTRVCPKHIRCICCQKYPIDFTNVVTTYNSLQFSLFICSNCTKNKEAIAFSNSCISRHMEYKRIFIYLLSHFLPLELNDIVIGYCSFFPFIDYIVCKGFRFHES